MKSDNHCLLAKYIALGDIPDMPLLVQPKLNGVRAWYDMTLHCLRTREGQTITSCPAITSDCEQIGLPLDGEIYLHGVALGDISGAVQRLTPSDLSVRLELHCFDLKTAGPQSARMGALRRVQPTRHVKIISTTEVNSKTQACSLYDRFLAEGFEGAIFRPANGLYSPGVRSLFKAKPCWD